VVEFWFDFDITRCNIIFLTLQDD